MRVLLVYPALSRQLDRFPSRPPLGVAYLAASLKQAGHECQIVDERFEPDLAGRVERFQPRAVGFSVSTWAVKPVLEKAAALKRRFPGLICLAGGPHATALPASLLQAGVDIVVHGYGEKILLEVLEALAHRRPLGGVAGISFMAEEKMVTTARAAEVDLSDLPPADYGQLKLDKYNWCSVSSSRGCPIGCTFCSDAYLFGRRLSLRPPAQVVAELERLYFDYAVRRFYFVDEQFTFSEQRAREICRLIVQKGLKISWTVNSRVDRVTRDMLVDMRQAGCMSIAFGVESGSDQILKVIHKGITPQQVESAVEMAKQAGLRVKTSWIVGLPGDMNEQLKSISLMERAQPNHIDVYWLTLYPGTPFWQAPEKYGIHFDPQDVPLTANEKLASTSYYYDYLAKPQVLEVAERMTERMINRGYKVAELEENDYDCGSRLIATYLRYLNAPDFSHELSK